MHSANQHFESLPPSTFAFARLLPIAALSLLVLGCRSGRPMNSMVQVTEEPSTSVAAIPAPEQRLATTPTGKRADGAKPADMKTRTELAEAVTGMPDVFQSKRTVARPASATIRKDEKQDDTTKQPAKQVVKQTVKQTSAIEDAEITTDEIEVGEGGLVSASLTDLSEPDEAAPAASSSEANRAAVTSTKTSEKREAASEDSATTSEPETPSTSPKRPETSVRQTSLPNDLNRALAMSLGQLPPLPDSKLADGTPAPTRIGVAPPKATTPQPAADRTGVQVGDLAITELPAEEVATPTLADERGANESQPGRTLPGKALPSNDSVAESTAVRDLPGSQIAGPVAMELPNSKPAPAAAPISNEALDADDTNVVRPASHAGGASQVNVASHQLPAALETPLKPNSDELSESELYGELLSRLATSKPGENPNERERRQIVLRHLMVLAGKPEQAINTIEGLNESEKMYLKNQLMGLWTMIDPEGHPSSGRRITEALPKYREAARHMAAATDSLSLKNLEFCTEIEAYGQIKPFEGNRFAAGQQVILYCEVENFAASTRNGQFQTQLQGSYDIYDASGTKVVSQLLPVDQQRSRNRLRDYFVAYQMSLPKGLPTGTYRLQLTLEDVVGKKYGQSNIPFEIR